LVRSQWLFGRRLVGTNGLRFTNGF